MKTHTARTLLLMTFVAVAGMLVNGARANEGPTAEMILLQQAAYFQKIHSLDFTARNRTALSEARRAQQRIPVNPYNTDLHFVYKDGRFLSDVSSPASKATVTYDGQQYQFLSDGNLVTGTDKLAGVVYGSSLPPFDIFSFVMLPGDDLSLLTFQDSGKWRQLASLVTSIVASDMFGFHGYKLTFDKPSTVWPGTDRDHHEVFFASERDYLPLYWSTTANCSNGKARIESKVLEAKQIGIGIDQIWVPVSATTSQYLDDVLQEQVTTDVPSITFDSPVNDQVFHLSAPPSDPVTAK